MELNEQFATENNLSTEQVEAINGHFSTNVVPELKKEWDGVANQNAEKIIQGAAKYAQEKTGLEVSRNEGEKLGDYLQRISDESVSKRVNEVNKLESDYKNKLKEFEGNDALKSEFEALKQTTDVFKQKAAQFDEWEKEGYKEKFEQTYNELNSLRESQAFNAVKPKFPDTVNEYEAKAKWDTFKKEVYENFNVKFDKDHQIVLQDKENEYKTKSLSDLVKENKDIANLLSITKNKGISSKPSNMSIEGVPFKVSANMSSAERTKAIKEYLTGTLNLSFTDSEYSKKFAELNVKLMGKTPN